MTMKPIEDQLELFTPDPIWNQQFKTIPPKMHTLFQGFHVE